MLNFRRQKSLDLMRYKSHIAVNSYTADGTLILTLFSYETREPYSITMQLSTLENGPYVKSVTVSKV